MRHSLAASPQAARSLRTSPFAYTLALLGFGLLSSTSAQDVGCLWEPLSDAPVGRFEAGTVTVDGYLYAFGGFTTSSIQATRRADRYHPVTDTWVQLADLPTPVTHSPYVVVGRQVWLLGGFVGDNPGTCTDEVWIYDLDLDQWTAGVPLPAPVAAGGACLLGGTLHYFGGCEADRVSMTGAHWVIDPSSPATGWQPRAAMPFPRCHLSGATLGGEIWAVGGQIGHDVAPLDTRYVHRYDAALDAWSPGPFLPRPRSHFEGATFVDAGFLYIGGGKNQTTGRDQLSGMLELDPVLESWSYLPQLPRARHAAGIRKIGDQLYTSGGSGPNNAPGRDLFRRDWLADYPNPLRINCGGDEVPAVSGSCCWCRDLGAENGATVAYNPNSDVLGTDEDLAFHSQRRSAGSAPTNVSYRFPMGNGFFRVRALFAERSINAVGGRVMDLTIEQRRLVEDLDLTADAGFKTAFERSFDVEVTDHALNISLQAAPGQRAVLAALEIERLDPGHFVNECVAQPNSTGEVGAAHFIGSSSVQLNELTLVASGLPLSTFGLFVQARGGDTVQLPGGTLCVEQPFYRLPTEQGTGATLEHRLDIAAPAGMAQALLPGSTWWFQCWYRDGGAAAGYGLTDALRLRFTP